MKTKQKKEIKVHLGCGAVYLTDYENIDVPHGEFYLAEERPDLVKKNATTIENYYLDDYYNNYYQRFLLLKEKKGNLPKPMGKPLKKVERREVVVDKTGYADNLPYETNSLSEIRLVQVFEHFTPIEGTKLLDYWYSLLKKGGKLILNVPDLLETAELLLAAKTEEERLWAEKLIYGTRNNPYNYHKAGYWPDSLKKMLKKAGFTKIRQLKHIHQYPAISLEAVK